jgi:hypothetical protein
VNPAAAVAVNPAPAAPAVHTVTVQASAVAPVPAPAPAPAPAHAEPPLPAPAPAQPIVPINAAGTAGASVTRLVSRPSNTPFVTVQWAETFIGGTYSTWWPHTISLDFDAQANQAPPPGKGEIGMGTLTGKTGQTQTIVMGAAPTQGAGWAKGVVAAVGVGVVGMMV